MDAHNKRENELRQRKFEVSDIILFYNSHSGAWCIEQIIEVKKLPKNYGYIYKIEYDNFSCDSELKWRYYSAEKWSGGSCIKEVGDTIHSWCFECGKEAKLTLLNKEGDYQRECPVCDISKYNYFEEKRKRKEDTETWVWENWGGASITYKERQKIKKEYLEEVKDE